MSDVPPEREPPAPRRPPTGEHPRLFFDGDDVTHLLLEFAAIRDNTTKILAAIIEDRARVSRIEADAAHASAMNDLAHEKFHDRLAALEAKNLVTIRARRKPSKKR